MDGTREDVCLLAMEGVRLRITDEAPPATAQRCIEVGAGARSLRAALQEIFLDVMREAPSRAEVEEICLVKKVVLGRAQPLLGLRSETG